MKTKNTTNGNGKYLKGDDALVRARKIYVLRHFGGLTLGQIATALNLTGERVRQVLKKHREPNLWLVDFSKIARTPDPHAYLCIRP